MGDYLEAIKAAEEAKQKQLEQEQQKAAAQQKQATNSLNAARQWVKDVLTPAVEDLRTDIAAEGSVTITDMSNPHDPNQIVAYDVMIALNKYPPNRVSFHIRGDGAVNAYQGGAQGNTLGAITTVNQARLKAVFLETLRTAIRA